MQIKRVVRFLFCLVSLITSSITQAQTVKSQTVFVATAGASLVGGGIDLIVGVGGEIDTDTTNNFIELNNSKVSGGRALIIGFDHGLSGRWSIGGFFSTQRRHGSTEFSFLDADENVQTETVKFDLRRNAFGFSPKIHFGQTERIDLYSGVRMGFILWADKIESQSGQFKTFDDLVKSRPFFGLTPIGVRFYPNEFIGLSFELNLGAPNILGLGAVVKIQ